MPFIITKEMVLKAVTYMPLQVKIELAEQYAELCLKDVDIAEQNEIGQSIIALPHLKGEDLALKNIMLLHGLLTFYFGVEMPDLSTVNPYEMYDYYAGAHLLNQIERFKADAETKDIVFDLLADYKEFKKIVDTELYNQKANVNDLVPRLAATIAVFNKPETVTQIVEELKEIGASTTKELEKRKKALAEALEKKEKENENADS